jgi:putative toxin-antitoxin system antitoxin component (TIGR02293 family)
MAALAIWTPGQAGGRPIPAPGPAQRVVAALLRSKDTSPAALSRRVERGLPFRLFTELAVELGLTHDRFAALLRMSPSTLYRRRRAGRFEPDESDRLWRYVQLYATAVEVLEGRDAAARWLAAPLPALADRTPLEAASDAPGARAAEDVLVRLEYGVFG